MKFANSLSLPKYTSPVAPFKSNGHSLVLAYKPNNVGMYKLINILFTYYNGNSFGEKPDHLLVNFAWLRI